MRMKVCDFQKAKSIKDFKVGLETYVFGGTHIRKQGRVERIGTYCITFKWEADGKEYRAGWTNCGIIRKGLKLCRNRKVVGDVSIALEKDGRRAKEMEGDECEEQELHILVLINLLVEKIKECSIDDQKKYIELFKTKCNA